MSDQEAIIHTLKEIRRRARVNWAIRIVAFGLGIFLIPLLTLRGLEFLLARPAPYSSILLAIWTAAVGAGLMWKLLRSASIGQAAGLADSRASLKDELKTAYEFIRESQSNPWIELQIHRAAFTARRIDPRQIVPMELPRRVLLLDGALLALGVLLLSSSQLTPLTGPAVPEVQDQVQTIEDLLRASGEEGQGNALQDFDGILRKLGQNELSMEDALHELWEAENQLAEAGLDVAALQSDLDEIADSLQGLDSTRRLGESLQARDMEEAADLLRSMAEQWKKQPPGDLSEMGDAMALAETQSQNFQEWLEAMRLAVNALGKDDPEAAEQLLTDAANSLNAMNDWMRKREQLHEASKQIGKLRDTLARQDRQSSALKPPDADRLQLDAEDLSISSLDTEWKDQPGGGPKGYPSGPGQSAGEAERPTSLEVQLEREMIESEQDLESPVPEEIQERKSRENPSRLAYEEIQFRSRYAEADVMSPDRIPWRFRDLIKNYFLTIRGNSEP